MSAAYVLGRSGALAFQCRPAGISGKGGNEAEVALDYAEVRVRYTIK